MRRASHPPVGALDCLEEHGLSAADIFEGLFAASDPLRRPTARASPEDHADFAVGPPPVPGSFRAGGQRRRKVGASGRSQCRVAGRSAAKASLAGRSSFQPSTTSSTPKSWCRLGPMLLILIASLADDIPGQRTTLGGVDHGRDRWAQTAQMLLRRFPSDSIGFVCRANRRLKGRIAFRPLDCIWTPERLTRRSVLRGAIWRR
jgi:hypothetical protein